MAHGPGQARLTSPNLVVIIIHMPRVETILSPAPYIGVLTRPMMDGGRPTSSEMLCIRPLRSRNILSGWSGAKSTSSLTSTHVCCKSYIPTSRLHSGSKATSPSLTLTAHVSSILGARLVNSTHRSIKSST